MSKRISICGIAAAGITAATITLTAGTTLARVGEGGWDRNSTVRFSLTHLSPCSDTTDQASSRSVRFASLTTTAGDTAEADRSLGSLRTQTTAYTRGLLIPVDGRDGKQAMSTGDPLRTQTCRNETGLLVPYYSASETAKPTSQPVGTLTCVDRYALVTLRNHGEARQPTDPMTTVTASGNHHGLLDVSEEDVLACRFRMLEPHEIALGMSFPGDYRWRGTKRERVRLAGNAVTPPAARDLVMVVAESITGERIEVAA